MKTMNFLVLLTMIFSLNSCTVENNQTNDTLDNVQLAQYGEETENEETYFEASLHQHYLESQKHDLEVEKKRLVALIEEGQENYVEQLEQVQQQLAENEESLAFLIEQFGGIIPRAPTPRPCVIPKRTNCPVPGIRMFNLLSSIENGNLFIRLSTAEGEVYQEINEPSGELEGMLSYPIEMEGDLIKIEITKEFEVTGGETTYSIFMQRF
ncbi:hypothetical protein [Spongiivirga citrea]|uniref:Uncharacterized protein n=1 Tax=Spongiivirga citrea TaxID=1481457 RepID=A0A6M0CT17_9FLAO|nr:hypothetical protein [Spongiivirga citrea]NER19069.1 hypothetical protein [Spongiivirga citrea]